MIHENQRIIDRIRKLQKHAESARQMGSLNEYFAFAERITELLTKYNLSELDIKLTEGEQEKMDLSGFGLSDAVSCRGEAGSGWRRHLLNVICQYNYCRSVGQPRDKTVRVYGRGENVETTIWLYLFLSTHFLAMARQHYKAYHTSSPLRLTRFKFIRHFLLGAVDGLGDFYIQQTSEASTSVLLYNDHALDAYESQLHIEKVTRTYKAERVDKEAYSQGHRIGKDAMSRERKLRNHRRDSLNDSQVNS